MKLLRILLFSPVFIATLVAGLLVVRFEAEKRSEPISLCEAIDNRFLYNGLDLTISARFSGNAIHDGRCGEEYGRWANVEFSDQPEFDQLKGELRKLNTADAFADTGIVMSGRFEYFGPNCVSQDTSVVNARILSAEPVTVKQVN